MGGDNAPNEIIDGAQKAVEEHGIPVLLVGRPEVLEGLTDLLHNASLRSHRNGCRAWDQVFDR